MREGNIAKTAALAGIAFLLASCSESSGAVRNGPANSVRSTPSTSSPATTVLTAGSATNLGPVAAMALSPEAVYALYAPSATPGPSGALKTRLVRIDRKSGAVLTAGPFPWATTLAVAGSSLWIGGNSQDPTRQPPETLALIRLDASTLKVLQRLPLPPETAQPLVINIAADSNSLWVALGSHLYRMNASTGHTLISRTLIGNATSIALDPSGQRLYVGIDGDPVTSQATVSEWDATTLRELASSTTGGGDLGGPQLAAGTNDVWVAFATGMLGQVEHRRAVDLQIVPGAAAIYTNAVRVFVAGGMVWATDDMAGRLMCLDPLTGAVVWSRSQVLGGVIAGDDSGLYLGDNNGVAPLLVDPRCR